MGTKKLVAWSQWFLQLAGMRIVLMLFALVAAVVVRDVALVGVRAVSGIGGEAPTIWLGRRGPPATSLPAVGYSLLACILMLVLGYCAYRATVAMLERRPVVELESRFAGREFAAGTLVGVLFVMLVVSVIWMAGALAVTRGLVPAAVASAAMALTAAFMEELAVRGVIFRIVEERLGTWLTLALTAAIFGLLHLGNQNATWASVASIALSAGVVLGLAFVLTRRLWLAIGLHFGVNLTQGAILGLPVSGGESSGLVVSELTGPGMLTGGEFGIESSVVTVILALAVALALARLAGNKNQIRKPCWGPAIGT